MLGNLFHMVLATCPTVLPLQNEIAENLLGLKRLFQRIPATPVKVVTQPISKPTNTEKQFYEHSLRLRWV